MENSIVLSKEVLKSISKNEYYNEDSFIKDVLQYIEAIKEGRVIVSIVSVSKSGMSRKMKFLAYQKHKDNDTGYYRQFNSMFEVLGWKIKDYCLKVDGCGMDMVFHVNYSVMHNFKRIGLISEDECGKLAQQTPTSM